MTRLLAMTIAVVAMMATSAPAHTQEMVVSARPGKVIYPDIWGWVLPMPEGHVFGNTQNLWIIPDGQVLAFYDHETKEEHAAPIEAIHGLPIRFRVYNLFRQQLLTEFVYPDAEPRPLSDRRVEAYKRAIRARDLWDIDPVLTFGTLPDGGVMEMWRLGSGRCRTALGYYLRKMDSKGNLVWRRMLIHIKRYPKPDLFGCVEVTLHTESLFGKLYALPDGTFLFWAYGTPLIVRFHGALESPYVEASDDLLVIDVDQMKSMLDEVHEIIDLLEEGGDAAEGLLFTNGYVTARLWPLLQARKERLKAK